jgi:hypothetical protein
MLLLHVTDSGPYCIYRKRPNETEVALHCRKTKAFTLDRAMSLTAITSLKP